MWRSGRTFKPMVQGSNPCAGTKSEFGFGLAAVSDGGGV
jgi:hypothetical protein